LGYATTKEELTRRPAVLFPANITETLKAWDPSLMFLNPLGFKLQPIFRDDILHSSTITKLLILAPNISSADLGTGNVGTAPLETLNFH
jgi:hypothetical protein